MPTENRPGMTSTLETALAQRCGGSYQEGFALRPRVRDYAALDPAGSIPIVKYEQESQEEAVRVRTFFEVFMQERNIPSGDKAAEGPSYGWFEDAAEGQDFVGSYGRVFDVIVLVGPTPTPPHYTVAQSNPRSLKAAGQFSLRLRPLQSKSPLTSGPLEPQY